MFAKPVFLAHIFLHSPMADFFSRSGITCVHVFDRILRPEAIRVMVVSFLVDMF